MIKTEFFKLILKLVYQKQKQKIQANVKTDLKPRQYQFKTANEAVNENAGHVV